MRSSARGISLALVVVLGLAGSHAQAATALHRSQSAVSYAVARLQEELDVPLLVIEGRKAVLTPHGETLLQRARGLLRDMNTLELLARSLERDEDIERALQEQADLVVGRGREGQQRGGAETL